MRKRLLCATQSNALETATGPQLSHVCFKQDVTTALLGLDGESLNNLASITFASTTDVPILKTYLQVL